MNVRWYREKDRPGGGRGKGNTALGSCFILVSDWLCVTSPAIGRGACSPAGADASRRGAGRRAKIVALLKWPTVTRSSSRCKNRDPVVIRPRYVLPSPDTPALPKTRTPVEREWYGITFSLAFKFWDFLIETGSRHGAPLMAFWTTKYETLACFEGCARLVFFGHLIYMPSLRILELLDKIWRRWSTTHLINL